MKISFIALSAAAAGLANGQALPVGLPDAKPELNTWNTSYKLTPEQIKLGQLDAELAANVEQILNFDRTQLANGGPTQDSFYDLASNISTNCPHTAGQLLKLQAFTDPTNYSIPSQTSLSRIIYSTTNFNGTLIPASAYILWPYTPKVFSSNSTQKFSNSTNKAPVVLWTHGTSGFFADGAPSAHRSLFYANYVPFTLAQAGYVVVATDYAGLGVSRSWDGTPIPHQYLFSDAAAGDGLNAVRAARTAFPSQITDKYVVMGHSQGGGASWAIPQLLANQAKNYSDLLAGYLGTVVFNPASGTIANAGPQIFLPWIGQGLSGIFPEFNLSEWLSPLGVARTQLLRQIRGGQYVSQYLFANATEILNPAWNSSWYTAAVQKIALGIGNTAYRGPVVLFQGTNDRPGGFEDNMRIWNETCNTYGGDFEFVAVDGAMHFPTMDASRAQWLKWVEDRFEGRKVVKGCSKTTLKSFLPQERYQVAARTYLQWTGKPEWLYETPAV